MANILVLHGPNLNLLGEREPEIYGSLSLAEIDRRITSIGAKTGFTIRTYQSNSEGALIDALHESRQWANGIIFNPGGYTHTSVALHDAILAIKLPVVEVHLSNPQARENFRQRSLITPVCIGTISGFGWKSYELAIYGLQWYINNKHE